MLITYYFFLLEDELHFLGLAEKRNRALWKKFVHCDSILEFNSIYLLCYFNKIHFPYIKMSSKDDFYIQFGLVMIIALYVSQSSR